MAPAKHGFPTGPEAAPDRGSSGWAIKGIFFLALFAMLYLAAGFIVPVILAFLLFFVVARLRRALVHRGMPKALIGGGIVVGLVFVIMAISALLIAPASQFLSDMPQISGQLEAKVSALRGSFEMLDAAIKQMQMPNGVDTDKMGGTAVISLVTATPELLGQIVFVLVLLFFLILSGDLLYLRIVQSFDTMADKRAAYRALRDIEESLGQYLGAITVINAILGLSIGLTMWALGMPNPAMFGILAFLLNYVPYLGAVGGVALSTLVAVLTFPGIAWPLLVGGSYLTLTSIEGQLITPYFVSRRLQMNPVMIFMSITLGAYLWGVVGMVVAVPMVVVISVICDHMPTLHKFGNFLAGEEPPPIDLEDRSDKRGDLPLAMAHDPDRDPARIANR